MIIKGKEGAGKVSAFISKFAVKFDQIDSIPPRIAEIHRENAGNVFPDHYWCDVLVLPSGSGIRFSGAGTVLRKRPVQSL